MLTSWEGADPKRLFIDRLEATKVRARAVQQEVDRLRGLVTCKSLQFSADPDQRCAKSDNVMWCDKDGDIITLTAAKGQLKWSSAFSGRKIERLTVIRAADKDQFTIKGSFGKSVIVYPEPGAQQIQLVQQIAQLAAIGNAEISVVEAAKLEGTDAEARKLEFLVAQMSVYTSIMKILICQVAKLDLDDIQTELHAEQMKTRDRFFIEASRLLRTIDEAFDAAVVLPATRFRMACEEFHSLIQQYPCETATAAAGGIFTGAAVAASTSIAHPSTGGLVVGSHLGGGHLGHVLASMTFGGMTGFFVVAGVVGLGTFAQYSLSERQNGADDEILAGTKQLEQMIDALRERGLASETVVELRELFDRCFVRPIVQPHEGENCILCCEPFAPEARETEQRAIRAPLCDARHFCHMKCQAQWMQTSQDLRCIVCRQ